MSVTTPATHGKLRSIVLLIIAEIAAMSLWFVSAAILGDMSREANLSPGVQAAMSAAVQLGFVIGALASAVTGISDRFQPKYILALFALLAALSNACLLYTSPSPRDRTRSRMPSSA